MVLSLPKTTDKEAMHMGWFLVVDYKSTTAGMVVEYQWVIPVTPKKSKKRPPKRRAEEVWKEVLKETRERGHEVSKPRLAWIQDFNVSAK